MSFVRSPMLQRAWLIGERPVVREKSSMAAHQLSHLRNIGNTVALRLGEVGIKSEAELRRVGAAQAYQLMAAQCPGKRLPVCYYLYSLEGALQDRPWDALSEQEKAALRLAAGLPR
ncbi:TfoX/Sxy family DNA transformation protein [Cyanobium sp. Lug-B]